MLRKSAPPKGSGLTFDHVALTKRGPTLAMEVPAGSSLAIMGPAASGKSRMLAAACGSSDPVRGSVSRLDDALIVGDMEWSRRDTPMSLAREIVGKTGAQRVTDALTTLNLWEVRQKACNSLSPSQRRAVNFLPALLKEPTLVVADCNLDDLDLLLLESLWSALSNLCRKGMILVYTTNRPDLGERADFVLVVRDEQVVFSGTPDALRRTAADTEIEVFTDERPGVRAIADPFEVEIEQTESGLRMRAKEGQALVAKLLLEGYGDVRYLVQRPSTFAEALSRLMAR